MGPDIFLIMYVCLAFELMEIKKANEKKKIGVGKGVQRCVGRRLRFRFHRNHRGLLSKSLRGCEEAKKQNSKPSLGGCPPQ